MDPRPPSRHIRWRPRSARRILAWSLALAAALGGWQVWAQSSPRAPDQGAEPGPAARPSSAGAESQATPSPGATEATEPGAASGAALYDRLCLACHGTLGDGHGPAAPWLWPRPRDLTRGEYKWRTTPSGAPPTRDDLAVAIRHGVPGTSMHGFGATLDQAQITALVTYLEQLAPQAFARPAEPLPVGAPPPVTAELVERGKTMYGQLGCVACHGPDGTGEGPAADSLRTADGLPASPYDLTTEPLRRPRAPETPALVAIYTSMVTGLTGTPMPAYAGAVPDEDLWAVAAYVDAIRYQGDTGAARAEPTSVHPVAVALDRDKRLARAGYWPGQGTEAERAVFGETIPLQGAPPDALTPSQRSLDADQCARCHAKQLREWRGSFHAGAASPGLYAQLGFSAHGGASLESCQRCHAPLAEQLPELRPGHRGGDDGSRAYQRNPRFDDDLRRQGINCAGCHVRGWTRLGPPDVAADLLSAPGYPRVEASIYERSDFCLGCHQLPPRLAVNGRPLLNTYREWLEGPYMRRGIQCQHCHMPNREHTWKGVHDPETFRQGIELETIAGRSGSGTVSVRARVTNVGAGHYLPTTPTPAAWLEVELVDRRGEPIPGARAEKRIGRHLDYRRGWIEHEDTRIPPGESLELAAAWKDGAVDRATHARITVRVSPDDYYERLYRGRLRHAKLTPELRALYQQALDRAQAAHYVALDERIRIAPIRAAR